MRGRGIRKGRGCILVGELEEVGRLEGKVADDGCGKGREELVYSVPPELFKTFPS